MVFVLNWRDVQPKIAHMSAVHWGGLRDKERENDEDQRNRLLRLNGFARHALQGRKTSDHHQHQNLEQVYYILGGKGEVLYNEERYPVEEGDAIYLPSGEYHQMFNDMNESWLEHHVISMGIEGNGGQFAVRNWRQVGPLADGEGGLRWRQLSPQGAGDGECLRGMAFIERVAVQPRNQSAQRCLEEIEQVYYVLENSGLLTVDGEEVAISEGDMIHLPPGTVYQLHNPHQTWLTCMVMAA